MRTIAFEIIYGVMEQREHSDERFHLLAEQGRKRDGQAFTRQEKSFLRRLSYGTIERALFLDAVIELFSKIPVLKMKPAIRTILRMGTYEILFMDAVPASATCNEMVKLARKKRWDSLSGFVNGVLRSIAREENQTLRRKACQGAATPEKRLSVLYSVPEELAHMLVQAYGKKTAEKIFASFYDNRPVTIRVQTMNASVEQVREELAQAGVCAADGVYMDTSLIIRDFERIESLPGFAEGHFVVQDESSMLPVLISGIRPGDTVLDVCASPGGKTFHAADLLKGGGTVLARDVSQKKLRRLRENAKRLRAEHVTIEQWDAVDIDAEWSGRADVVLADVPCSGIGVIGRKPEIRYHAMEHARELAQLQKKIAAGAAAALRPGGTLVYSTCTIHPRENEEVADWIENHLPLKRVSLDEYLPEALKNGMTARGMIQILPGIQSCDGFFAAKFIKDKDAVR